MPRAAPQVAPAELTIRGCLCSAVARPADDALHMFMGAGDA